MDKIVSIVSLAPQTRSKNDDDFSDRISSRYTVVILVVFAIVVSMNQYVGNPITCWAPVHFTGSHIKFTNSYCWVRNTYYLPWEDEIPRAHEDRQTIPYYQWIPFILLGQAIFFYLPTVIWHGLNSKAGVDADNILETANALSRTDKVEDKDKTLGMVSKQIDRFLESRKSNGDKWHFDCKHLLSATLCRCCGKRVGNYLVLLFLFSKLCYIGNVVAQMFILNRILGTRYNWYGIQVLQDMVADHDWTEANIVAFPRVTMCDFRVRRLGNIHRYTVQCVLPINLYNEKIYIFLWFWMLFVAIISGVSFVVWLLRFLMRWDRLKFVRNHLIQQDKLETDRDKEMSKDFLDNYLRQDGAFILRLIAHNTNNITTTEITCALWDQWKEYVLNKKRKKNNPEGEEEEAEPTAPDEENPDDAEAIPLKEALPPDDESTPEKERLEKME